MHRSRVGLMWYRVQYGAGEWQQPGLKSSHALILAVHGSTWRGRGAGGSSDRPSCLARLYSACFFWTGDPLSRHLSSLACVSGVMLR